MIVTATATAADQVTTTITVQHQPDSVTVTPDGSRACVAN